MPTLRSLSRAPGLAFAVAVTIAASNAALIVTFGVVNAALFRQPPFDDAGRVMMLFIDRNPQGERPRRERWSYPRFQMLAQSQRSFESVASYSPATLALAGDRGVALTRGGRASAADFAVS